MAVFPDGTHKDAKSVVLNANRRSICIVGILYLQHIILKLFCSFEFIFSGLLTVPASSCGGMWSSRDVQFNKFACPHLNSLSCQFVFN